MDIGGRQPAGPAPAAVRGHDEFEPQVRGVSELSPMGWVIGTLPLLLKPGNIFCNRKALHHEGRLLSLWQLPRSYGWRLLRLCQ